MVGVITGSNGQPLRRYPDGSYHKDPPADGCTLSFENSATYHDETWLYDGFKDIWVLIATYPIYKNYNTGIPKYSDAFKNIEIDIKLDLSPKCECGAEKVGSPKHSTWCQKFSNES